MTVRLHHHLGLALILLATAPLGLRAEEKPRSRPTPIIFSAPQSDTVSSNLNQISTKTSPLTDLESGLKKPFEVFESGRSSTTYRPASRDMPYVPPPPVLKNKKLKDLLEKEAEDAYLRTEEEAALSRDESWKSEEDPLAPSGPRSKSPLDLYYDRIERNRSGQTNQGGSPALAWFGDKPELEAKDDGKPRAIGGLFDIEMSASARTMNQMTNRDSGDGRLTSERLKTRSFGEIFGLGPVEPATTTGRTKDSRLDDFKRLLDGPGYGSSTDFNVAPPPSSVVAPSPATQPVLGVVPPPSYATSPTPGFGTPSVANASSLAGAVGTPLGLPEHSVGTPSLTPTPSVQPTTPKPPPPTFNIPRRRF